MSGDLLVDTQAVVVVLGMNSNHELDMFLKSCNLLILQSLSSRQKPQRQGPATKSVQNTFRLNRSGASLLHSSVNLHSRRIHHRPFHCTHGGEAAPVYASVTRRSTAIRVSIPPSLGIM